MTTSLGDLALFFYGDTKNLEQSIADAKRKAVDAARDIEKVMGSLIIKPKVDDSALYALNRHIELKRTHVKEVNSWMQSNPIRVQTVIEKINSSSLEQQVKDLSRRLEASVRVKATIKEGEEQRLNTSLNDGIQKGFDGASDKVKDAVKGASSKPQGGGIVSGAINSLTTPLSQALAGAFTGIGLPIGEKIGGGIAKSIEQRKGINFEEVGAKLETYVSKKTATLTNAALSNIGLSTEQIEKDIVRFGKAIDSALDPEPIGRAVKKAETLFVKVLEDAFVFKDFSRSKSYTQEQLSKAGEKAKEVIQSEEARPYAGAALRVAAYPFKIRRSVEATRQYQEAEKMAQNIQVEDIGDAKSLTLAIAGKNNVQGAGSAVIAPEIQKLTGSQSHVVPVANPYTDSGLAGIDYFVEEILAKADKGILGAINNLLRQRGIEVEKLSEKLTGEKSFAQAIFNKDQSGSLLGLEQMLTTGAVLGYNPDSVSATAHAIAYRKAYPDLPINIIGHSGGGEVAQGSAEMLSKGGIQANAVGLGTPTTGLVYAGNVGDQKVNYTSLMGDKDYINWQFFDDSGMTPSMREEYGSSPLPGMLPKSLAPIVDVPKSGALHSLPAYLGGKTAQQAMAERLQFAIPSTVDEQGNIQADVSKDYQSAKPFEFIRERELHADKPINALQTLTGSEISTGDLKRNLRDIEKNIEYFSSLKKGTGEAKKDAEEYIDFLNKVHAAIKETLAQGQIPSLELKEALDAGAKFHKPIAVTQKELSPVLEKNIASEQAARAEKEAKEAKAKAEAEALAKTNKTNLYRYPEAVKGAISLSQDPNSATRDLIESRRDIDNLVKGLQEDAHQLENVTQHQIDQYIKFLGDIKANLNAVLNGEPLHQMDAIVAQADEYFNDLQKQVESVQPQPLEKPLEMPLRIPLVELKQPEMEMLELPKPKQEAAHKEIEIATPPKPVDLPKLEAPKIEQPKAIQAQQPEVEEIKKVETQAKETLQEIATQSSKSATVTLQEMALAVDNQMVVELKAKVASIREAISTADASLAGDTGISKAYAETVSKLLPDLSKQIESGLSQLSPQDRMGSEIGNQLANLKSQLAKVEAKTKATLDNAAKSVSAGNQKTEPYLIVKDLGNQFTQQIKSAKTLAKTDPEAAKKIAANILLIAEEARAAIDEVVEASGGKKAGLPIKGAAKTARQLITRATNAATEITGGEEIGSQVGAGLSNGLTNSVAQVKAASHQLAQASVDAAKNTLDIHSPSRVFEGIGRFVVEGFQKGLDAMKPKPGFVQGLVEESQSLVQPASIRIPKGNAQLTASVQGEAKTVQSQVQSLLSEVNAQLAQAKLDEAAARQIEKEIQQNQKAIGQLNQKISQEESLKASGKGVLNDVELGELRAKVAELEVLILKSTNQKEKLGDPTATRNRLEGIQNQAQSASSNLGEILSRNTVGKEEVERLENAKKQVAALHEEVGKPLPSGGFLSGLGIKLPDIIGHLGSLAKGFIAFQGVMIIQNFMSQLASSTTDAAIAMESLQRRIGFVSGSAAEGAKNLAFVRDTAQGLGTDIKASLEGFTGLASSTRETALEGEPTRQIFKGVSQASTVYDLDGEKQGRVFAAVQQMASKGKVSAEELRQQLGESLPGAFQIAARAMGMTTEQLDKMMASGQLLSEDFLPKFAQQLSAETQSGVAGAANSSVSAMISFNNALFEAQAAFGEAFLPARNEALSVLAKLLNFAAKNADTLKFAVQFLALALGVLAIKNIGALVEGLAKIPGVAKAAEAAMSALGAIQAKASFQSNQGKATGIIEELGSAIGGFKNAPLASSKQAIASLAESVSTFATGSISNAKQGIGSFVGGLTNLRGTATGIGQSFASAAGGIKAFGMSAATNGLAGLMALAGGIRAIMAALAPLLVQFLIFQAAISVFKMIQAAFSDTSGDTREFANTATKSLENYKNALAEARGETLKFKQTRDETLLDAAGAGFLFPKEITEKSNWFDKARYQIGRGVGAVIEAPANALKAVSGGRFGATWEDKKFADQQISMSEAREATNQTISEQYTMLGANGKGARELAKMKEIDKELEALNTKRRASASLNPEDKAALRAFDEQQALLLKQREAVSKPIGILQAASQSNIDSLKKQIEKYESLASEPGAHQAEYRDTLAGLKSDLEAAQTAQEKFNRSVGEAVNAFTLLQRNVQKVQDELADTADRQALVSNRAKTQTTLNAITNNVTPGQVQKQTNDQAISDLADKLTRTTKAYTSTVALTNTAEADTVRKAYGVTSETGQAELKTLADKAKGSGDTKAEYFLNQFGAQKKAELDISQIQSELANAEKAAKDQLDQSNRAIADYYRSVDKQTQELAITAEESSIKIAAQQMKNKVLDAMSGFQDNVFTQLADSIVNILDELNKPIEEQLNAQKQIQSNNFGYQDQLRQVNSIRRNSPDFQGNEQDLGLVLPNGTNLNQQSIPVSIDIQNLDSSKLDELNQKIIGVTKPSVDEVNASTQAFQGSITTSGQAVSGTLNPAIDSAKSSSDILNASLGTQAGTIQNNAAEMSGFSLSTDTSKNASDILAASLGEHAPLIQGNAATMTGFTGTTDTAKEASDKVQKSLAVHAPTINTATKAQSVHGATMQQNMGIATKVAQTLLTWTNPLGVVIKLTIDWFRTIANNIPLLGQVQQAMSGIGGSLTGSAQNMLNNMGGSAPGGSGEGVGQVGSYTITDSNYGHAINQYDDLSRHHAKRGNERPSKYANVGTGGKQEETRLTSDGRRLIEKDMVLTRNGSGSVPIPAPVAGYVKVLNDAWNTVQIYADQGMTKLMAQSLHMRNRAVKTGDYVKYGQTIGIQGDVGSPGAVHAHIEMSRENWIQYVKDLKDGTFEGASQGLQQASGKLDVKVEAHHDGDGHDHGAAPQGGGGTMSNMDRFLHVIAKGESNFDYGSTSSVGAAGYFQFIGGTRRAAIARTGKDPVTPNIQQAAEVSAAWIKSEHPEAYKAIEAGDFQRAYYLLGQKRLEWTSLPGARESNWGKNSSFSMPILQQYESGQFTPKFHIAGASTAVKGVTGTYGAGGQAASVAQQSGVAMTTPALTSARVWTPEWYGGDSTGQQALNQAANQAGVNNVTQNQQAQAQANANGDTALIQARKQLQSASEQLRQQMIQQGEQSIRGQRFARDENLSSQIQTPEVQYQQSTNKINDQFDDAARNNGELIRKLQSTLDAGKALQTLLPQIDNTDELIKKLQDPEYQKKNPGMDTAKLISELQRSGLGGLKQQIDQGVNQTEKDLAAAKQLQGQYEELRNKKLAFEAQEKAHKDQLKQEELKDSDIQNQAKLMEAQIAAAKQYQQTHPFDTSQGDPIEMQKTLDLLNEELSIRKQIRDIEEKKRSDPANSKAYDNQIAQLKEQDKQLRANIETRTKLESDQRQADQAKAILENKQFATQMSNDLIAARSQATDLFIKNHPFDFSQGDPLKDKYQSDFASLQIEGESKLADFDEKNRLGKFIGQSAEDIAKLRQGIVDLNALKLDNLQAEFEQTFKEREQQRLDFLLNQKQQLQQSDLDVLSAQQGNLSAKGLSTQSNALGKKIAIAQQGMSFEKQIRELEKLAATGQITAEQFDHMKSNAEQLNDVKLQGIQDQFSPWTQALTGMQGSFKGFFADVLSGSKSLKDAFKDMVNSILSNLANMAAEWLTNKLFGDIFGLGKSKKSGSQWFAGSMAGDTKQQETPMNNIVPFTNPANATGFAQGVTLGTNPMQPMYVSDVSQQPFGQIVKGGDLFGGSGSILDGMAKGSFFSGVQMKPMQVDMVSAANNVFDPITQGFSGVMQGLGGLFGDGTGGSGIGSLIGTIGSAIGGGGMGGMGGGAGSLISTGLSLVSSIFGFADGGKVGEGGFETKIPNYANGKLSKGIEEAMQRERMQSGGRTPQLAVLNTDELVLSAEQTEKFEKMGGMRILNFANGRVGSGSFAQAVAEKTSNNVNISVPINVQGSGESGIDEQKAKTVIESKMRAMIEQESRPGGVLASRFSKR